MPGCILHISGATFEVDDFIKSSALPIYKHYHLGDKRNEHGAIYKSSGFLTDVSNSEGLLSQEVQHAISFLKTHQAELSIIAQNTTITHRIMDFGYYQRDVAVMCERLPSELLRLAGVLNIDIQLSLYPPLAPLEAS